MNASSGSDPLAKTLADAVTAMAAHAPEVAKRLITGEMAAAAQREFAELLVELAELLTHHANGAHESPTHVPPS